MTYTYDLTTDIGQTRLLCTDRVEAYMIFSDEEIQAFLDMSGDNPRYAAADALDQIAATQTLILKYIEINGLKTNGPAVASALHSQAVSLREQASRIEEEDGYCEIVSGPYTRFTIGLSGGYP